MKINMNSSSNFNFQLTKTRRKKRFSEVMPVGEDLVYFILLSDAYLTDGKNERHIHSLEDIKDVFEGDEDLRLLQAARAKGQLTEGVHALPKCVVNYLVDAGADSIHIRRWMVGVSEPAVATAPVSWIKNAWGDVNCEEIEVGDLSGKWYFRSRDDDALVFLAVRRGPLLQQIRQCEKYCREVTGDFIYAL